MPSGSSIRKHLQSGRRCFADLMSPTRYLDRLQRFMAAPTLVNGVPVQVTEIVGEPSDLWLMHPAALHTLAPNVLETPRLVLEQFIYPSSEVSAARPPWRSPGCGRGTWPRRPPRRRA